MKEGNPIYQTEKINAYTWESTYDEWHLWMHDGHKTDSLNEETIGGKNKNSAQNINSCTTKLINSFYQKQDKECRYREGS